MADAHLRDHAAGPLQNVKRTGEFWARATAIYMSFKVRPPLQLTPSCELYWPGAAVPLARSTASVEQRCGPCWPALTMRPSRSDCACAETEVCRAAVTESLVAQVTQAKAVLCRTRGWDEERIANELWEPQHERAGERMYRLCIDLRGFYLKV